MGAEPHIDHFAGPTGKLPFASLAKPNLSMNVGWADRLAHKQMANSEFPISVLPYWYGDQLASPMLFHRGYRRTNPIE